MRAGALYLPITLTLALAVHRRPDLRRATGALLATLWNVAGLLALNAVAVHVGWWRFDVSGGTVMGVPADLWLGWALLWGAVPILATTSRLVPIAGALIALDLVLMPLAEPVVRLDASWLIGEAVAVCTCLLPGLALGRWTAKRERLPARAALQIVAFAALLYFVVPALVFTVTGEDWSAMRGRPRWQFLAGALVLAPVAAMAVQAVLEFVAHGGTPVPLDPPASLVTTGPYAFVRNPMQLAGSLLLAAWGIALASPAVVLAAAMGAAFSAGVAAWHEGNELAARFGSDWPAYRSRVRPWLPRWRPVAGADAVVYAAGSCDPCREVGAFLASMHTVGLAVQPAEECTEPLRRIRYQRGDQRSEGVAAIARSLEHVNLGWAAASWMARLPGVQQVLQLITDAVGGEPRSIPRRGEMPPCAFTSVQTTPASSSKPS